MTGRTEVEAWLRDWFAARAVSAGIATVPPGADVFESGVIDSLGVLELIAALEQTFGVRFDETHLQDPRFVTIEGLADLVSALGTAAPR